MKTEIPAPPRGIGSSFGNNNFDLIRLFAASQVVLFNHYATYFKVDALRETFMGSFSGVLIFFFISGFLISASYERNPNLLEYGQNRCLRIFPALWSCLLMSVLLVAVSGYPIFENLKAFFIWFSSQLIFPVYNPHFLREYGVGVVNGSLWTIPVELQFYILIPVFYAVFRLWNKKPFAWKVLLLIIVFYLAAMLIKRIVFSGGDWDNVYYKLYCVSFIPHIFVFLMGVFFQQNFSFFKRWLSGRFWACVCLHLGLVYIPRIFGFDSSFSSDFFQLPLCLTLSLCVFSFAYSYEGLSLRLLRRNDISYGVYIYHMPVANFILYKFGKENPSTASFFVALAATYALSFLSWKLIEHPCLELKRHPLNPINRMIAAKRRNG